MCGIFFFQSYELKLGDAGDDAMHAWQLLANIVFVLPALAVTYCMRNHILLCFAKVGRSNTVRFIHTSLG